MANIDIERVLRNRVLRGQVPGNLFWFDTEAFTLRPGVMDAAQVTSVFAKLRSTPQSFVAKAVLGQISELVSGGGGATATYAFSASAILKDVEEPGSMGFVASYAGGWAAHPGTATGAPILLDNFAHADTLTAGVWTDSYDHARLDTRFNFAFFLNLGTAGTATLVFPGVLPRSPIRKGGSAAANFKLTYTASGVLRTVVVADSGVAFTDSGTLVSAVSVNWDTGAISVTFTSPPDAGTDVVAYYQQDWIATPQLAATNNINHATGAVALALNVAAETGNNGYFCYTPTLAGAEAGYEVMTGYHVINKSGAASELRTAAGESEDAYSATFSWYPSEGDKLTFSFYAKNLQGSHRLRLRAIDAAGAQLPLVDANILFRYGGSLSAGDIVFPFTGALQRFAVGLDLDVAGLYALQFVVESLTSGLEVGSRQAFVTGFQASVGDVLSAYVPPAYIYHLPRPTGVNSLGRANEVYTANGDGTYAWQKLASVASAGGGAMISLESGGVQVAAPRQKLDVAIRTDDTGPDGLGVVGSIPTATHILALTDVSSAASINTSKRGLLSRLWFERLRGLYDGSFPQNVTPNAFKQSLLPVDTLQVNLGSNDKQWSQVYARSLIAFCLGDWATATTWNAPNQYVTRPLFAFSSSPEGERALAMGFGSNANAQGSLWRGRQSLTSGAVLALYNRTSDNLEVGELLVNNAADPLLTLAHRIMAFNAYGSFTFGDSTKAYVTNRLPGTSYSHAFYHPVTSEGDFITAPAYNASQPYFCLRSLASGPGKGGALFFGRAEAGSLHTAAIWARTAPSGQGLEALSFWGSSDDLSLSLMASMHPTLGIYSPTKLKVGLYGPRFGMAKASGPMFLNEGFAEFSLEGGAIPAAKLRTVRGTVRRTDTGLVCPIPGPVNVLLGSANRDIEVTVTDTKVQVWVIDPRTGTLVFTHPAFEVNVYVDWED